MARKQNSTKRDRQSALPARRLLEKRARAAAEEKKRAAQAASRQERAAARAAMAERVGEAAREAQDRFYHAPDVAARYAHADNVREFLATGASAGGSGEAARVSMSRVDASVSRIDELIADRDSAAAAARRAGAFARSGVSVDPRTPAGALLDEAHIVSIDDFARRVLGLDSIDGLGNELFDEPYQVAGLAGREPNPRYEQLSAMRDALERRRDALRDDRSRIRSVQRAIGPGTLVRDAQEREALRRQLVLYAPIDSVQLLKPASEVRALNERWRNLLGDALLRIYADYESATARGYDVADGDGAVRDGIVAQYVQRVAAPVFNRYVEQLRSSTYEDMPLTLEVLRDYFYRFLRLVLDSLMRDESANGEEALAALRAAQAEAAGRNFAFGLDDAVRRAGATDADADAPGAPDERAVLIGYLRQALHLYAVPEYAAWLERWLADIRAREPGAVSDAVAKALRDAVRRMVEGRERAYRERVKTIGRPIPRYRPPAERDVVRAYRQLVTNEVALERAKALAEQDDDESLRVELQQLLAERLDALDPEVLVRPRIDRLELLATQRAVRESAIRAAFPAGGTEAESRAREAALGALAQRAELARAQLALYAPLAPDATESHGPADEAATDFDPLDLSYPLDVNKARAQTPQLTALVLRELERFDAAGLHERANEMRAVLSYSYADRLTWREINRIDYALEHLALPTRPAPLTVARRVRATQSALQLDAQLELRDELKLARRGEATDERIEAAAAALRTGRFEVRWLFKPRYAPGTDEIDSTQRERVLRTERLAPGQTRATLRVEADGDTCVSLGGLYRVEFQALDADGTLTGAVYRSPFTANVRIFARCCRDQTEYEVGTEQFGDCEWRAAARDAELAQLAEDLRVLVTEGRRGRQEVARARLRSAGVASRLDAGLFRAPWGADDEASLLAALGHDLADGSVRAQFTYTAIFGRFVKRIAAQMRAAFRQRNLDDSGLTDLGIVALLVDPEAGGGNRVRAEPLSMQLAALYQTSKLCFADRSLGEASRFELSDEYDIDRVGRVNVVALRVALDDERIFAPQRTVDSLPSDAVETLRYGTTRSLAQTPLATMLYAAYAPAVWQNLSARERRYVHALFDRFERFAEHYRAAERVRMYADELPSATRSLPLLATLDAGEHRRAVDAWHHRTPILAPIESRIDARLARMLPSAVARQSDDPARFLHDAALEADWRERLGALARRGLVVEHELLRRDERSNVMRRSIEYRLAPPDAKLSRFYANTAARTHWRGAHSYRSMQPDVYELALPADGPARVVRRGSAPRNLGFDFDALHELIEGRVARYNAAQRNADLPDATRRAALATVAGELRDLELVYNFLALVAPPVTPHARLGADELRRRVKDRGALFASLRALVAVNAATSVLC